MPSRVKITRRKFVLGGLGLAAVTASGTAGYALEVEPNSVIVTTYRLNPQGWPPGRRLSITVIADLHAGGPNMGLAQIRQIVDLGNLLKSDLAVLLGDYFASHRFVTEHVPHAAWAGEMARLNAPLGTFAVLGNHDWWNDVDGVREALRAVRIPVLENEARLIEANSGGKFWLAGLGDQLAHKLGRDHFRGEDDLDGTLAKVTTDDPVILLAHEPDIFVDVPQRVSLTLSGHTHGGQVRIPFIWKSFVPSAYGARFAYGHVVEDERHLIVSGGLGTSFAPVRLGVPPEIVRIELGDTIGRSGDVSGDVLGVTPRRARRMQNGAG